MVPSSPLFLAKIRTEVFVSDGFVGVVDLNSWSRPPSFSLAKIRTEILVLEGFVRVMDLNSWSPSSLFFSRKNPHRDFGFGGICQGYGS